MYTQSLMLALSLFTASFALAGGLPTAKKAAEMANARVGGGKQFQVIRLEGSNADSDLRPRQWDVTVYNPANANHAVVIRIKDNAVASETGAVRLFDDARWTSFGRNFTGYDLKEILTQSRWKLDSTDALRKIAGQEFMSQLQLVDVKMELRKLSDGDVPPVWRVSLRARLKAQPGREAWIGSVDLNAETGELLKNETHPDKLKP